MIILHGLHILVFYKKLSLVAVCLIRIHAKKSAGGGIEMEDPGSSRSWKALDWRRGFEVGQTSRTKSKDDQGPVWKANTSEINHEAIEASLCFCIERPDPAYEKQQPGFDQAAMQCHAVSCNAIRYDTTEQRCKRQRVRESGPEASFLEEMKDVKSLLLSYVSYFTEHAEKRARAILDSISCVYY